MRSTLALAVALLASGTALAGPVLTPAVVKVPWITCSTQGDALGAVDFQAQGTNIVMKESEMSGATSLSKSAARPEQIAALNTGKALNFFIQGKGSTAFGGAVSNSTLVALGPKAPAGKMREAFLARKGIVYVLQCGN